MVLFAWVMFFLFCVGLPLSCFVLLFLNRAKINPSSDEEESLRLRKADPSLDSIRFLFSNYRPAYWYWEVVEMIRRIFMTGVIIVLARGSFAQIIVCQFVSILSLAALARRQPFLQLRDGEGEIDKYAPDNNNVAAAMTWQTICTLSLCMILKGKEVVNWEDGTGALTEGMLDAMLVACQFMFLVLLVWKRATAGEAGGDMVTVLPVLEEGESDSAKIARLEREKVAAENGREEEKRGMEAAENGREEEKRGREKAEDELERLKKDV